MHTENITYRDNAKIVDAVLSRMSKLDTENNSERFGVRKSFNRYVAAGVGVALASTCCPSSAVGSFDTSLHAADLSAIVEQLTPVQNIPLREQITSQLSSEYVRISATVQDLIAFIRNHLTTQNTEQMAKRIQEIYSDCLLEEDGQSPLSIESVSSLINFFQQSKELRLPGLVVTYDGNICAEWHGVDREKFVVEFLPTGQARYVIFSRDPHAASRMDRVSGIVSTKTLLEKAAPFGAMNWISV